MVASTVVVADSGCEIGSAESGVVTDGAIGASDTGSNSRGTAGAAGITVAAKVAGTSVDPCAGCPRGCVGGSLDILTGTLSKEVAVSLFGGGGLVVTRG